MQKQEIESLIKGLFRLWSEEKAKEPVEKIRYSGISYSGDEYSNMVDAIFNGWWSGGKYALWCERTLAKMAHRNHGLLFNSGSSANLVMIAAAKELYFKAGDKILTMASGFPTTLNPIIQNNLEPYFIDIDLSNMSIPEDAIEKCPDDVRGVFIPHTLGFTGNINKMIDDARKRGIIVMFDACDAYGSSYCGVPVTNYGKAASYSFYAAHHVSCGEGGGVVTNDEKLNIIMRGMRGWGRYCSSAECCIRSENKNAFCSKTKYTNDCDVPDDYPANYQFEWAGYNLKMLDLQAAILSVQLGKLGEYTEIRRRNYNRLYDVFSGTGITTWSLPENVSPFAFPIIFPIGKEHKRKHLMDYLARSGIESRVIFGGNLLRHPAYKKYNTVNMPNSDIIMDRGMMLGVSHVVDEDSINYVCKKLKEFCYE